jgi:hypothetical protein
VETVKAVSLGPRGDASK